MASYIGIAEGVDRNAASTIVPVSTKISGVVKSGSVRVKLEYECVEYPAESWLDRARTCAWEIC